MTWYVSAILFLTGFFWFLRRAKVFSVCPVCAAAVVTWAGGIIALYFGADWADPLVVAVLMGASMGALAEKYGMKFGLIWKTSMVVLGLAAIYHIILKNPYPALGVGVTLLLITWFASGRGGSAKAKDLFKDCC